MNEHEKILGLLKAHPKGLRFRHIRALLNIKHSSLIRLVDEMEDAKMIEAVPCRDAKTHKIYFLWRIKKGDEKIK